MAAVMFGSRGRLAETDVEVAQVGLPAPVAKRLRELRLHLGLSQKQVSAFSMDVLSPRDLGKLERGESTTLNRRRMLWGLAQAFKVHEEPLGEYLGGHLSLSAVLSAGGPAPIEPDRSPLPAALQSLLHRTPPWSFSPAEVAHAAAIAAEDAAGSTSPRSENAWREIMLSFRAALSGDQVRAAGSASEPAVLLSE